MKRRVRWRESRVIRPQRFLRSYLLSLRVILGIDGPASLPHPHEWTIPGREASGIGS
jgi:hypothetical protein